MLERHPGRPIRVFVVWEPVIVTDVLPPGTTTLARIPDPRVAQFWDRKKVLSDAIVAEVVKDPSLLEREKFDKRSIAWDVVALYPAGVRWDGAFPKPAEYGFPVVGAVEMVERRLAALLR
jgi:hypothetical protein